MRLPRATIGRLMVVVVFLALGLSALARPTRLGASMLSGSILSALTVALIGVVADRGARRMFFAGFLIAGWSYIIMDYWGEIENLFTRWEFPETMTLALDAIFNPDTQAVAGRPPFAPSPVVADPNLPAPGYYIPPQVPTSSPEPSLTDRDPTVFPRTVHMLLAWSAATVGGLFARWIYQTRRDAGNRQGPTHE